METEVIIGKEYDGTHWRLTICDHKIGPPMDDRDMRVITAWFGAGGLQGVIDGFEVILDKAFKEQEK